MELRKEKSFLLPRS